MRSATAGFEDGTFFPLPEPVIMGPATRVMSLRDGTKKMSKSDPSDLSRINMTDDADTIAKKIQKAKTDPEPLPDDEAELEKRPEADNLVGIYAALAGKTKADGAGRVRRRAVLGLQEGAGRAAVSRLAPVNAEMNRLLADPAEIDRMLADGARKAQAIAAPIVDTVKDIVGFLRSARDGPAATAGDWRWPWFCGADDVSTTSSGPRLLAVRDMMRVRGGPAPRRPGRAGRPRRRR